MFELANKNLEKKKALQNNIKIITMTRKCVIGLVIMIFLKKEINYA